MFLSRLTWLLPTQIANSGSSNASVVDDSDDSAAEESAALDGGIEESPMVRRRCCMEMLPMTNRVQGDEISVRC